ncbi:MAG TPA: prolyl oligopeptidase family serine peptidase [Anaeromyxobacteraceae bacterium]|nr:prolyl oligopeptidase family serine peptidase [Anaeromyxobacteraceae bacterium]
MTLAPLLSLALLAPALAPPPATPRRPVSQTYHGVAVSEDYRWLENGADPEVQAWSKAQDARARAWLSALPGAEGVRARVRELVTAGGFRYSGLARHGETLFALKFQPPRQQRFLVTLASLDASSERPLVDPNAIDPSGRTAIDFFVPSPDGKLVAVSLSRDGTEDGTLHVYQVATGKELPDAIPRVNGGTAGGSAAWNADSSGLFYTRYPREGERPAQDLPFYQQVWFHRLGTPPDEDVLELGKEFPDPRIAESRLASSDDGRWTLCSVQKGDGGDFVHFLRAPSGAWTRFADYGDEVKAARFGRDGNLYLLSRKGAPRGRVLRMPLESPSLEKAAAVAEASPEGSIESVEATRGALYVEELAGGPSRVRVLGLDGTERKPLPIPPVSSVRGLTRLGEGEVVLLSESYLTPATWYRLDEASGTLSPLPLSPPPSVDFSDVEVRRELAVSKDGTKVPMTILLRKGTRLDGQNPTILYGYGGYGVSQTPAFVPSRKLWLERGGVYAVAAIRGGGENGEAWHQAGMLARKQNTFDDFAACARHLVARKYTSPTHLGLLGGSNGGLLMGAMITQYPELMRAVAALVGVFDMLRVELHPNGAFNVTEYGTVQDPSQFRALYAYSPYHRVKDRTRYPAVLLTAGNRDPRVDAWHARKMAARLQAASASGRPVLLRVSESGHGMGSALDERIAETADLYAFFLHELSVPRKALAGGR